MGQDQSLTWRPEKIRFTRTCIKMMDSVQGGCRIPYKELVRAGVEVLDKKSGIWYEPEITEITPGTVGNLIFLDVRHRRFHIKTELTGRTAGDMLSELVMHAPYILIGAQSWFDEEDEEAFSEIKTMTELMQRF